MQKNILKITKISILFISFFLIMDNFDFKLTVLRFSKIIEFVNNDFYYDLNKIETTNYKILYDDLTSQSDIDNTILILNKCDDILSDTFNLEEPPNITIRILSKFNESHSNSLGYVYFHNKTLNILNTDSHKKILKTDKIKDFDAYTETLVHEYTHVLLNEKLIKNNNFPNELPFWFNEGIAEFIGKKAINKNVPTSIDTDITPNELDKLFETNPKKFYEESSIFISYLVNNFGLNILGEILNELKFGSFEIALEKTTKQDFDDLSIEVFNSSKKNP